METEMSEGPPPVTPMLRENGQVGSSPPSEHVGDAAPHISPAPMNGSQQAPQLSGLSRVTGLLQVHRDGQPPQGQRYGYQKREWISQQVRQAQGTVRAPFDGYWPKQGAPNTKRFQESLDRESEEKTERSEFLRPPQHHQEFPITARYVWFDKEVPPTILLGDGLQMLDDVRAESKAFIDYEDSTGSIRIRSQNLQNIDHAITGIKVKVQHARADAAKFAPLFVIEPPPTAIMKPNVAARLLGGPAGRQQPVVQNFFLCGPSLPPEKLAAWEKQRNLIITANQSSFREHIQKSFASFHALKSGMRMRVYLGHVQLHFYHKDFLKSSYSYQKFSTMFGHGRTQIKFQKELGDLTFATNLIKFFGNVAGVFDPIDPQADSLAETKPVHSLIAIVRQRGTSHRFRVESPIEILQGKINKTDPKSTGLKLKRTSTEYYKCDSHKSRFTFGSLGFESNFDWSLDMMTYNTASPPLDFQGRITALFSCAVVQQDQHFLSYPSIALASTSFLQIEKAMIKSILEYKLKGSPYTVEVSIFRLVESQLPKKGHVTECGVRFYNKNWDLLMAPDKDVTNQRDWSEDLFFPSSSGSNDGLTDFLDKIHVVQTCLDSISSSEA